MSKTASRRTDAAHESEPVPAPLTALPLPATSKTAAELLRHLRETGMPARLDARRADLDEVWLKAHEAAPASDLYRHLEATGAKAGTLRRAGKFVWGPEFEPISVVQQAPADELLRLREENARLADNNRALTAEKLGLQQANNYLRDQLNDLTRQVTYLKVGRSAEDLARVGLAPAK